MSAVFYVGEAPWSEQGVHTHAGERRGHNEIGSLRSSQLETWLKTIAIARRRRRTSVLPPTPRSFPRCCFCVASCPLPSSCHPEPPRHAAAHPIGRCVLFVVVAAVPAFAVDRRTALQEMLNGAYGPAMYCLSQFIASIPYIMLSAFVYQTVFHWLVRVACRLRHRVKLDDYPEGASRVAPVSYLRLQ